MPSYTKLLNNIKLRWIDKNFTIRPVHYKRFEADRRSRMRARKEKNLIATKVESRSRLGDNKRDDDVVTESYVPRTRTDDKTAPETSEI